MAAFFLNEESRPRIETVLASDTTSTLDFALVEVLNAVWKSYIANKITQTQARFLQEEIERSLNEEIFEILRSWDLSSRALQLSIKHNLAIYDSLFIAACLRTHNSLLTLDGQQKQAAQSEGIKVHSE